MSTVDRDKAGVWRSSRDIGLPRGNGDDTIEHADSCVEAGCAVYYLVLPIRNDTVGHFEQCVAPGAAEPIQVDVVTPVQNVGTDCRMQHDLAYIVVGRSLDPADAVRRTNIV